MVNVILIVSVLYLVLWIATSVFITIGLVANSKIDKEYLDIDKIVTKTFWLGLIWPGTWFYMIMHEIISRVFEFFYKRL